MDNTTLRNVLAAAALSVVAALCAAPVTLAIPDNEADFAAQWTLVEGTGTWEWQQGSPCHARIAPANSSASGTAVGTSLVWAEPIHLTEGDLYFLQANVCSENYNDEEYFAIVAGTSLDNLQPISTNTSAFKVWRGSGLANPNFQFKPADTNDARKYTVPATGDYYIGIRSIYGSGNYAGKNLYFASLLMERQVDYPQKASGLKGTADATGALAVTLEWTYPTKTYSGADAAAPLGMNIYRSTSGTKADIYKAECLVGTVEGGEPGAKGSFTDNAENSLHPIEAPGKYYYYLAPYNEAGENGECTSAMQVTLKWVGEDEKTLNPLNAVATAEGDGVKVSFRNRLEGYNGGIIIPEKFSNQITRSKDGAEPVVIAESVQLAMDDAGNAVYTDDALDGPGVYEYTVYGLYMGNLSVGQKTSKIFAGGAFDVPYTNDFSATTALDMMTQETTSSSYKWSRYSGYASLKAYASVTATLFTPPLRMEAGKTYRIAADAWTDSGISDNKLTLVASTTPVQANGTTVSSTAVTATAKASAQGVEGFFIPEVSGNYYVGFSASTASNKAMYITNLSVTQSVVAPAAVSSVTVTPDAAGADSATVSFTLPSLSNGGATLTSLTKYEVARKAGAGAESTVVKSSEECTPGEEVSFVDEIPAPGYYSYTVTTWLDDQPSDAVTSDAPWVGYDTPKAISAYDNFRVESDGAGTPTFTWAPLAGTVKTEHGGYYDADGVKYRLYRTNLLVADAEPALVAETEETTYCDASLHMAEWAKYRYSVAVVNGQFEGRSTMWNTPVTGGVVELPFTPDLTDDTWVDALEGRGFTADAGIVWRNRGETNGTDFTAYLPPFNIDNTQFAGIKADISLSRSYVDYEENLELYLCTLSTPAAQLRTDNEAETKGAISGSDNRELIAVVPASAVGDEPETVTVNVPVSATGKYRLALRCSSPENKEVRVHALTMAPNVLVGVDGIRDTAPDTVRWFDLSGREVKTPGSGLYIRLTPQGAAKVLR